MTPSDLITSRLLPILSALADHLGASRNLKPSDFGDAHILQWERIKAEERTMRGLACDALDAVASARPCSGCAGEHGDDHDECDYSTAIADMVLIRYGATEDEIRRWAGEWEERAEAWEAEEAA